MRGTLRQMIGSRKMVPSRMLRMVPLGTLPHLLQAEFLDAGFVGRDGGAFDRYAVLLGGVGGVDGDLVVGRVALLDDKIVIFEVDIQIGQDQALADPLPDDAGHFVAVHFDDGVFTLILAIYVESSWVWG